MLKEDKNCRVKGRGAVGDDWTAANMGGVEGLRAYEEMNHR